MNDEEHQYFIFRITGNREVFYGIWYTNESDGVAVENGKVLLWRSEDGARDYARQRQWALAPDEPATFNLDYISAMKADLSVFRPKDSLDLWNLFSDIGRSLAHAEFSRLDSHASDLHARLSAIALSHILGSEPGRFTDLEIDGIVTVLHLGKTMLTEQGLVLG